MATDLLIVDPTIPATGNAAGTESRDSADVDRVDAAAIGAGQGSVVAGARSHDDALNPNASTGGLSAVWSDYVQLTKPRIVVMILVTTVATAMIAAGGTVAPSVMGWLLLGTAAIAASAGAANQIWERKIDLRMARTANRPLPGGRVDVVGAIAFTAALGVFGTWLLAQRFGPIPAIAGAMTWFLYVVIYTPMKTRTAWNTTVGAIAGALPMLIGYTALGGSLTDATAWLLVGILVAWQYPHFMAIAWMYRRQYGQAGFQMTTTVEPTGRSAALQSVFGSLVLIGFGIALCVIPPGTVSAVVASLAVVASCYPMLKASCRFAADPSDASARTLLRSSLLVLPAVLAIVTVRVFW